MLIGFDIAENESSEVSSQSKNLGGSYMAVSGGMSRLRLEACSGNPFFLLIRRGFKPHTRKQGQFMSATRLGIVSSTTKFLFLQDSLPVTQGHFTCLQYSADRPWPFSHTTGLQSFVFFSYLMAVVLRNRRQVDSDHRIRVLIVW